jgi:hypothetical protein
VIVTMIVPALRAQGLAEILHRSPRHAVPDWVMAIR